MRWTTFDIPVNGYPSPEELLVTLASEVVNASHTAVSMEEFLINCQLNVDVYIGYRVLPQSMHNQHRNTALLMSVHNELMSALS